MAIECSTNKLDQRGASRLTQIVFAAIFGAIAYTAYSVVPFFYCYFELHNQFLAIIPAADGLTDQQVRQRLTKIMKDLDVPADPKELKIDRGDHKLRLRLSYDEILSIPWKEKNYDLHSFHFDIDVEGPF